MGFLGTYCYEFFFNGKVANFWDAFWNGVAGAVIGLLGSAVAWSALSLGMAVLAAAGITIVGFGIARVLAAVLGRNLEALQDYCWDEDPVEGNCSGVPPEMRAM